MNNPFQEQFLKAGVVNKQQVQKAKQEKKNKNKQQRNTKGRPVDEAKLKAQKTAQQAIEKQAERDRELNKKRQDQAKGKALSAEINQLIKDNYIKRNDNCDIAYNFEHQKKVKKIYINEEMKLQIIKGKLGIARIEGMYELIPVDVAEKIKQRNEKRVVIFEAEVKEENDPYADYEVPDDLVW